MFGGKVTYKVNKQNIKLGLRTQDCPDRGKELFLFSQNCTVMRWPTVSFPDCHRLVSLQDFALHSWCLWFGTYFCVHAVTPFWGCGETERERESSKGWTMTRQTLLSWLSDWNYRILRWLLQIRTEALWMSAALCGLQYLIVCVTSNSFMVCVWKSTGSAWHVCVCVYQNLSHSPGMFFATSIAME